MVLQNDMNRYCVKIQERMQSGFAWEETFAKFAVHEFVRCLELKGQIQGENPANLSMPLKLDIVWHQALLWTKEYADLCEGLLGAKEIIHHSPDSASDCAADKSKRRAAMARAYEKRFGRNPLQIRGELYQKVWNDEDDADFSSASSVHNPTRQEIRPVYLGMARRDQQVEDDWTTNGRVRLENLSKQSVQFSMGEHTTILKLLEAHKDHTGIPLALIRLVYGNEDIWLGACDGTHKKLDQGIITPATLGMKNNDIIFLRLRLQGC